ncbi:MAG: HAD family phosphatase [Chloroflexota bacterium]
MDTSPSIEAVIFDVGGVLDVPSNPHAEELDRMQVASELGLELDEMWSTFYHSQAWRNARVGKITEVEFWNQVLTPFGIVEPEAQWDFITRLWKHKEVNPAMRSLIESLHGNIRLAIISNATDILPWILNERFQVAHFFEVIINSWEVGYAKPDPEIYNIALRQLDLDSERTVFIDDQLHNVVAAQELGMHAVQFDGVEALTDYLQSLNVPGV